MWILCRFGYHRWQYTTLSKGPHHETHQSLCLRCGESECFTSFGTVSLIGTGEDVDIEIQPLRERR